MNIRSFNLPLVLAAAAVLVATGATAAQPDKHGRRPPPPRVEHRWDHGYWHHGWHANHLGWWWIVGPSWYFYSVPVYPYWYAYPPPVRVIEEPAPSGPPPTPYWYWCNEPRGYYPYVPQCPGGWTPVPATPPDAPKP